MLIVHVALHFSCNAADFFGPQVAVQCRKLYGDKTNIQRNEHIFKIVAALVIISGQTGEVFDNYTVDFLCVNISQKPLKVLTVAVSTSPSIVLIVVYHLDFRVVCQIIVEDSILRRDLSRWFSAKAHQKMQWGCRTLLVRQPCCNSAQICKCIAQMGIKAERLIHSLIAGSAGDGQAGKGVFFAPFLRCLCQ